MIYTMEDGVADDIFVANVDAIVCPVNAVGVMGKGLALEFKKKFPLYYNSYRNFYSAAALKIGELHLYYCKDGVGKSIYPYELIISFPTKKHWKDPSKLSYIEEGLKQLAYTLRQIPNIKTIVIPALGCGLGGLNFKDVKKLIITALEPIKTLDVFLYEPKGITTVI